MKKLLILIIIILASNKIESAHIADHNAPDGKEVKEIREDKNDTSNSSTKLTNLTYSSNYISQQYTNENIIKTSQELKRLVNITIILLKIILILKGKRIIDYYFSDHINTFLNYFL